jgi:hypothetical protein
LVKGVSQVQIENLGQKENYEERKKERKGIKGQRCHA